MFAQICRCVKPLSINYKKLERQTPNKTFDVSFELWQTSQVVKDSKEASGKALLDVQPLVERAKNQHSKPSRFLVFSPTNLTTSDRNDIVDMS